MVQEFKRRGEMLTVIDLNDSPEHYYQHHYPLLIGIDQLISGLVGKSPQLSSKLLDDFSLVDIWTQIFF